ncbi:MAG: permease [Chthoniobacteraceae bacterium]
MQSATADFLDVAFFLVIGTAITSVFNTAVDRSIIDPLATNPPLAIVAMMGLAAAVALCSTTDAFIAASFVTFPFAAKLAFLLFGPVFDLKLFWLYGLVFQRRWVVALALGLFVVIAFISWRISALSL